MLLRKLPQVAGAIDYVELSTPLSTRNFVAHPYGEIYGLAVKIGSDEENTIMSQALKWGHDIGVDWTNFNGPRF